MGNSKPQPKPQKNDFRQPGVLNAGTENTYSDDAEKTLIGTILANGDAFYLTTQHITFKDFFSERNQYVWRAMEKLASGQTKISPLTVRTELQRAGQEYWNVVGQPYLNELINANDVQLNIEYYCKFIQRLAMRRQIISYSVELQRKARDPKVPEEQILTESEEGLLRIGQRLQVGTTKTMQEAVDSAIEHVQNAVAGKGLPVYKTGLADLDERLMIVPKESYLFAARPKVGKSALMLTIAMNMAKQGTPVYYESTEGSMSVQKLMLRAAAMETGINYQALFKGTLNKDELERFMHAMSTIKKLPIIWDCTASDTPIGFASKVKQNKSRYGIEVAICDGIYSMTTGNPSLDESDYRKFSSILEQMVRYCAESELPWLYTHQINRDAAKGKNKRPKKENLYYSGKVEQLVTAGIFLYREVLDKPDTPWPNQAELIIDFYRDGGPSTVYTYFDTSRMTFMNAARPRIDTIDPGFLAGDERR